MAGRALGERAGGGDETRMAASAALARALRWRGIDTYALPGETSNAAGPTHLTMWLLSDSICSREISRRVVEGTPSSSICGQGGVYAS